MQFAQRTRQLSAGQTESVRCVSWEIIHSVVENSFIRRLPEGIEDFLSFLYLSLAIIRKLVACREDCKLNPPAGQVFHEASVLG